MRPRRFGKWLLYFNRFNFILCHVCALERLGEARKNLRQSVRRHPGPHAPWIGIICSFRRQGERSVATRQNSGIWARRREQKECH